MKTIIAAIFLGILMHAFAKECTLMAAASNFNSDKYFDVPHVYVTHSKNGPKEKVCREYNTTKNSDKTTSTTVVTLKTGGTQSIVLSCNNSPKSGVKGQYFMDCQVPGGTGGINIQLESSIIATDNKNYALVHFCPITGRGVTEDIVVLQTNKDNVDPGVTSAIKNYGWSLENWKSRKDAGCQ
uniref:Dipetalodipin n=1 Tax=Dipetalogaster maximus TaxID=72496 RepID=DPTL_DIPMA|nr:RecName: Full=Dipetalodipin; Short=DPTL; AltName: Full=Salivary lipocalin; Flags: Precursor [Dipetalogaster maximus]